VATQWRRDSFESMYRHGCFAHLVDLPDYQSGLEFGARLFDMARRPGNRYSGPAIGVAVLVQDEAAVPFVTCEKSGRSGLAHEHVLTETPLHAPECANTRVEHRDRPSGS
jgi:hypothetical protein